MQDNMAHPDPTYRPDIDGLRAVAVLAVVFFHAGVPGFPGGFVGVDVFFVISGYLLTGILVRELDAGTYTLSGFYARRAKRILPALLVVVLASAVAGFYLMPPGQFAQTGQVIREVVTITVNNYFASTQTDYWAQSSVVEQPLLHTWSLAVEEQFYVLLPMFLWVVHRAMRPRLGTKEVRAWHRQSLYVLGVLAAMSFACAEWLLDERRNYAFFLLASRAWELLVGSMLALGMHASSTAPGDRPPNHRAWSFLGAVGLILILGPVAWYQEEMRFPGLAAVLPCAGALLVIYAGSRSRHGASRILSATPLVAVGLISYSLYLWHWPVLVFTRSLGWHARSLPQVSVMLQLGAMLALAALSWRFIEQPVRRMPAAARRERMNVLTMAVAALAACWSLGVLAESVGQGRASLKQEVPPLMRQLESDMKATPGSRCEGSSDPGQVRLDGGGCILGAASRRPRTAVIGDSHARMYTEALDAAGRQAGASILLMARSSCVPAMGLRPPTRPECDALTKEGVEFLVRSDIGSVVLVGYWIDLATDAAKARELSEALKRTVAVLTKAGKRVYLLKDVPELRRDTAGHQAAIESMRSGGGKVFGPSWQEHLDVQAPVNAALEAAAHKYGARIIDPATELCSQAQGCMIAEQGRSLYRDKHHLTDQASMRVSGLFMPIVESDAGR